MSGPKPLDKWEKTLLDCFRIWVGECVEDIGISLDIDKHVSKIWLHLTVAAAAKRKHLDTSMARKLGRI